MKTIGLIGGMSWESTLSYYKFLNLGVKERLGGLHSAKIILYSVDFAPIEALQRLGKWEEAGAILAEAAQSLQKAGADIIVLCTNTMHKVAPVITHSIDIPFVHIAEATAKTLLENQKKHAILLGTRFTMQEDFYTSILKQKKLNVTIPPIIDIMEINRIIFEELCLGICNDASKNFFLKSIHTLYNNDKTIDSVILGCTEIGLLLHQNDFFLPFFDTTILHVNEALNQAFSAHKTISI